MLSHKVNRKNYTQDWSPCTTYGLTQIMPILTDLTAIVIIQSSIKNVVLSIASHPSVQQLQLL